ncbi:hypothetical protein ACN28S_09505 [Cystobacter fuscus]
MIGVPTTPREQQALLEGWSREQGDKEAWSQAENSESLALRAWRQARAELPQETPSTPDVQAEEERDYALPSVNYFFPLATITLPHRVDALTAFTSSSP